MAQITTACPCTPICLMSILLGMATCCFNIFSHPVRTHRETLWKIAMILRPPLLCSLGVVVWVIPSAALLPSTVDSVDVFMFCRELCLVSCGPVPSQPLTAWHNRHFSHTRVDRFHTHRSFKATTPARETQHSSLVAHMIFAHAAVMWDTAREYEVIRSQTRPEIKAMAMLRGLSFWPAEYITRDVRVLHIQTQSFKRHVV